MSPDIPYDLIIFDCDGTLVDSEYLNNLATCELLAAEGLGQYNIDYAYEHFIGMKFTEILKNITAETGHAFPPDFAKRYTARAMELIPQYLKPIEGAQELVRAAQDRCKIAVASNGQRDNVIFSLRQTGLFDAFGENRILTGTDVKNAKPAPDLFLQSAEKQGIESDRCLVIEDSVTGATGGLAAGMMVYGFTGTHQNPQTYGQKLKNAGVAKVYNSLIHMRTDLFG